MQSSSAAPVCLKEPCARAAPAPAFTHLIEPDASRATPRSTFRLEPARLRPKGAGSLTCCRTDCGLPGCRQAFIHRLTRLHRKRAEALASCTTHVGNSFRKRFCEP